MRHHMGAMARLTACGSNPQVVLAAREDVTHLWCYADCPGCKSQEKRLRRNARARTARAIQAAVYRDRVTHLWCYTGGVYWE